MRVLEGFGLRPHSSYRADIKYIYIDIDIDINIDIDIDIYIYRGPYGQSCRRLAAKKGAYLGI